MRLSRLLLVIPSCVLQFVAAEPNGNVYQKGESDPIIPTPHPPVDDSFDNDIKLVDKQGRRVKLRLFIDNFQLVVRATSRRMVATTGEKELQDDWNDTSQDVMGTQRLHLWNTPYFAFDQLNASRSMGEIFVKRVPYKSVKLEFKARERVSRARHESLEHKENDMLGDEKVAHSKAVMNCCRLDSDVCSDDASSNSEAVAWFLIACIVAQILTTLSVWGTWSPTRLMRCLGSTYDAITSDINALGLHLIQPLIDFVCSLGRKLEYPLLAQISSIRSIIFQQHKTAQYDSDYPSRYPPFLSLGTSAGDIKHFHVSEGPDVVSSAFSSFSSYASELPFLRHAEPDRNLYNPVNFDLVRSLGEGHFGKVFQLQHRKSGQMVAVKMMTRRKPRSANPLNRLDPNMTLSNSVLQGHMDSSNSGATFDEIVLGEMRAMRRIQNSPYSDWSPTVLSTYSNEDSYFIVMPFYERGDIIDCMKRGGGCVSRGLAKYYIAELISAIHFLHTLRIVHRDIKPENLLLGADGHLVVADLGIAHVFGESSTLENSPEMFHGPVPSPFLFPRSDSAVWLDDDDFAKWQEGKKRGGDDFPYLNASTDNPHVITGEHGTPMYAAPEVFSGDKYSYGVDYYSMGMVYHQMITGYLPLADGGPMDVNVPNSERRWILDIGRHDLHLQILSTKERCFLEKVLRQDPFERPCVSKMKANPLFADIDWHEICRRDSIVPPALRIRRRGSLELATVHCESERVRFDSSSTCSLVDSNIGRVSKGREYCQRS